MSRVLGTAAVIAISLASSAHAAEQKAPNPVGGVNDSRISQDGGVNEATVEQSATTGLNGIGSSSYIEQIGEHNEVTHVIQGGSGNTHNLSNIYQDINSKLRVNNNTAQVDQTGYGNTNSSIIHQQSDGNDSKVIQTGTERNNTSNISQSSESNSAGVTQEGTYGGGLSKISFSGIDQFGDQNYADVIQGGVGSHNTSNIWQQSDDEHVTVTQGGVSNTNNSTVWQYWGSNTAFVTQDDGAAGIGHNSNTSTVSQDGGTLNYADVQQGGSHLRNDSNIIQTGSNNYAKAAQH